MDFETNAELGCQPVYIIGWDFGRDVGMFHTHQPVQWDGLWVCFMAQQVRNWFMFPRNGLMDMSYLLESTLWSKDMCMYLWVHPTL